LVRELFDHRGMIQDFSEYNRKMEGRKKVSVKRPGEKKKAAAPMLKVLKSEK